MTRTPSSNYRARGWHLGLRWVGATIIVVTIVWWWAAGAHRGWTMTQVPTTHVDEVTEIEYTLYEERLVPGVEILGFATLFGAGLMGLSWLLRPRPSRLSTQT